MTDADRGLVEAIRAELAAIDPPRRCCRAAEIAGLAGVYEPRRRPITRVLLRLTRGRVPGEPAGAGRVARAAPAELGSAATPTLAELGSAGSATVAVAPGALAAAPSPTAAVAPGALAAAPSPTVAVAPGALAAAPSPTVAVAPGALAATAPPFDWARAADHCRAAYLRGRFLAHGSLSLAAGRTHLEFALPIEEARQLCEQLAELEMEARWRVRRGRGVVTWKNSETVGTFLRQVGAGSALLELESRQVSRSVRGDLNRVINAESANLQRAVEAAARQLAAIDAVESDGRLAEQPYSVRVVADARREEPEATLSEIAERTGLHRSAVQRALERLEHLALHPDEEIGKKQGRNARRRASASRS